MTIFAELLPIVDRDGDVESKCCVRMGLFKFSYAIGRLFRGLKAVEESPAGLEYLLLPVHGAADVRPPLGLLVPDAVAAERCYDILDRTDAKMLRIHTTFVAPDRGRLFLPNSRPAFNLAIAHLVVEKFRQFLLDQYVFPIRNRHAECVRAWEDIVAENVSSAMRDTLEASYRRRVVP